MLVEAAEHLTDDGMMIVEIGTGRETLEAEFPELPFLWLDTEESEGEVFALPRSGLGGMQPR
jgi:ribosomal protein L3 glutamine methyltransferase